MRLKRAIILLTIILSVTLVFAVDVYMHPYMGLQSITAAVGYEPVISRINFFSHTGLYELAFMLSVILFVMMIVMIRRVYTGRLNRLFHVALPFPIALLIHFPLAYEIDAYLHQHNYIGFFKVFFSNLPTIFLSYIAQGFFLFLIIMLICYPMGILIDKLLPQIPITKQTPNPEVK